MLNKLIAFSLKHRLLIVVASLLILLIGTVISRNMHIDVLPDLNRPTVTIITEAHAMVPEDVERLVTRPIEQGLNGATGVSRIRSTSGLGLSVIFVEFDWGTDIYRNRQVVQERLQLATGRMPEGIEPTMAPVSSIMGQIQMIGLKSRTGDTPAETIRALVDQDLRFRLTSVSGVANVLSTGGAPRQLQVVVDEERLRENGVTIVEVAAAVKASNRTAGGGFIEVGVKAPLVTVTGLLERPEDLAEAVVKPDPLRPILIRDVAAVDFGPALVRTGDAGVNGGPGVIVTVTKQPDADTTQLTKRIDAVVEEFAASLPPDVEIIPTLFRQSAFIERAIHNIIEAVRDGGIMVLIVVVLFLGNPRASFITLTAIPLSIGLTAIIFAAFDIGLNTMTLGGIAVAIGALVDDAIVDVENCFRRLRQEWEKPIEERRSAGEVLFRASCEVRQPIVVGTIIVCLAYLPLFFLSGMEGRLFRPVGLAYIISVASSLLVALTLTPALCAYLLPAAVEKEKHNTNRLVKGLHGLSETVIRFSIRHAKKVLVVLTALVIGSGLLLSQRGTEFLPPFNEGVVQINLMLPPDTGLGASNDYGKRVENALLGIEGVTQVARKTGRAEGDEHAEGMAVSEILLTLSPEGLDRRDALLEEVRGRVESAAPGIAYAVDQPLAHLLSHMLSGVKAQVAIKLFGNDLDQLREFATEAQSLIVDIPGVTDVYVESQTLLDHITVEPHRDQLANYGLTVDQVAETVELSLGGEAVDRFLDQRVTYPIVVGLEADDRDEPRDLERLYLNTPSGDVVRLGEVATVRTGLTPNNIGHENLNRRLVVQHNVSGRALGEVVAEVEAALVPLKQKMAQHEGVYLQLSGQFEAQRAASTQILLLSLGALLLMALVLHTHFGSLNLSLQVMGSIPMAFIGAALFVVVSGQTVSVATLVGLISLGGIAARNAILLIDHYRHLAKEEGVPFGTELIVAAGRERMVPVVMTALTSGIALLPLALAGDEPGKEILVPVALVILGGLVSSTLLDFVGRPALMAVFGRKPIEALQHAASDPLFTKPTPN